MAIYNGGMIVKVLVKEDDEWIVFHEFRSATIERQTKASPVESEFYGEIYTGKTYDKIIIEGYPREVYPESGYEEIGREW